jgi:hypothetical protein
MHIAFPFGQHLQVEVYMGNKPKFGIWTETGHEDFAIPGTRIVIGHYTYHGDATQSPHPRTFFTEIVCSRTEKVTDELFDAYYREDPQASQELLSRTEKYADEYRVVADLISGIIGLRFHPQFVIKLLNEGFVAFHDEKRAVNNAGSPIQMLESITLNQPGVSTISQIFPEIGQLEVKEAERDSRVLGWLIQAWAERDIISKFNALFIPIEMILEGVGGVLPENLQSHIQMLRNFIDTHGGKETPQLTQALEEITKKIRPSLIDRFNMLAEQANMPGWENDKAAFKKFNGIRNSMLHGGNPNVKIHVEVSGSDLRALEDLAERYVNSYLFHDTAVYQSIYSKRPKPLTS